MSPLLKNLLLALVLIVLVAGGYLFLQQNVADTVGSSADAEAVAQETEIIIQNINRIKQYDLDESVFTDKRFTSLQETHATLPEVKAGRSNPFAPLR